MVSSLTKFFPFNRLLFVCVFFKFSSVLGYISQQFTLISFCLSKILRGHTVPHFHVPHFLRSLFLSLPSSSLCLFLRFCTVPHFLRSFLFSSFLLFSRLYLRFCVDILFRTFLDVFSLPFPLLYFVIII